MLSDVERIWDGTKYLGVMTDRNAARIGDYKKDDVDVIHGLFHSLCVAL